MRGSYSLSIFVLLCVIVMSFLLLDSQTRVSNFLRTARDLKEITSALQLTDLSFSTDARYTRHPSQADLFSAFQDYPGSIEHFPSGSVTAAPDFSTLGTQLKVRGQ